MIRVTAVAGELQSHRRILTLLKQALAAKNFSLIVIFPTISLLTAVQEELLLQPGVTGLGGLRLLLFQGFVDELAGCFGINQHKPTFLEQNLLITQAFEFLDSQGRFDYLNRVPFTASYRSAVLDGFAEWKRAGLSPDLFLEWSVEKGVKEQELAFLYKIYQQLLQLKGFSEDDLILAELESSTVTKEMAGIENRVLLYGFTELTPLQYDYIKVLANRYDFEALIDPTVLPEIQELSTRHFYFKKIEYDERDSSANALIKLQNSFWTKEPVALTSEDQTVNLILASGRNRQAKGIARAILRLKMEQPELTFTDFLIIDPQPAAFIAAATPVWREYGLPLPETTESVGRFPGVNRFIQALEACCNGWQWPDMELLIQQFYPGEQVSVGDRVILLLGEKYGALSGRERWRSLMNDPNFRQYFMELNVDLNPLFEGLYWLDNLPEHTTLENYLLIIKEWFSSEQARSSQRLAKEPETLRQQLQNYRAVQFLTENIEELLRQGDNISIFNKEIELVDLQSFCQDYLLNLELEPQPSREPALLVISPREARGLTAPVVFIAGLEQGVFPRTFINDWKLSSAARFELKTLGIELENGEHYQLQEKLAFYWSLKAAGQCLILVSQEQDGSGQPLNRSSFLEEVLRWFPDLLGRAERYQLAPELPPDFSSCYAALERRHRWATYLTANIETVPEPEQVICRESLGEPGYYELALTIRDWLVKQRRIQTGKPRINHPLSLKILDKRFGPEAVIPLTAIEDYRGCPCRFFYKDIIKAYPLLKPRLLPEGMDLGNLYHRILQEFGETYRNHTLTIAKNEEYQSVLMKLFEVYFREWQEGAASILNRFILTIQENQIRRALKRWLNAELRWVEDSKAHFNIGYLELAFGITRSEADPTSLPAPFQLEWSGSKVLISGQIDRVDINDYSEFIVYDYKLGQSITGRKMLALDYLQIPLYVLALEQLHLGAGKGVGGSYLSIKNPSRTKNGLWRQERLEIELGKNLIKESAWQDWLDRTKDELCRVAQAIRSGLFIPAAKCISYCEYQDCCRRQEWEVGFVNEPTIE